MIDSPCVFGERPQGPRHHADQPCRPRWESRLPAAWHARVVPPESFRVDREYEVAARRVVGYDAASQPCFCAYDYRLIEPRSDDDEEVYPALTYAESLKAWRLRTGRWLVHSRRQPFGEDGDLITAFNFAARMPR